MFETDGGSPFFNVPLMRDPGAMDAGGGQWRASVCIDSPGLAEGAPHRKRCEFPQLFDSQAAALQYAVAQCERQALQQHRAGAVAPPLPAFAHPRAIAPT